MVNGFLHSKKYNYAALYSSKAGCSSIRYLFMDLHKDELSEKDRSDYNRHDIKSLFPLTTDIKTIPNFLVIRNPYLRVVSMFTSKFIGDNNLIKRKFNKYKIKYGNSFLNFLVVLKDLKDKEMLNKVDCHIAQQSNKVDFSLEGTSIIDLDNFESGIKSFYSKHFRDSDLYKKVKSIISEPDNYLHSNKTAKTSLYENEDASKIEFTDTNNIPPYKSFYRNTKVKALVDYIYAEDFKNFNYPMTLPFN
jgi:hypothetical protein